MPSEKSARPENAEPNASVQGCVARTVVDTLAEESTLEAVTIDPANKKISVATLGQADVDKFPNG